MSTAIATPATESASIEYNRPSHAGAWWHRTSADDKPKLVFVTETPAGGRICKELRMGGAAVCGLSPWSGIWERYAERSDMD